MPWARPTLYPKTLRACWFCGAQASEVAALLVFVGLGLGVLAACTRNLRALPLAVPRRFAIIITKANISEKETEMVGFPLSNALKVIVVLMRRTPISP